MSFAPTNIKYHIKAEDDIKTGNIIKRELIKTNHPRVMYDTSNLEIKEQTLSIT